MGKLQIKNFSVDGLVGAVADRLLSATINLNIKFLLFHTWERKEYSYQEDFSRHVFPDMKLGDVSLINKEISSFFRTAMET